MPGIELPKLAKVHYYDYYDATVRAPLPISDDAPGLRLAADFQFTREQMDRPIKFSLTGPFSLAKRIRNEGYPDAEGLVLDIARVLNREARDLAAAGATLLQIDEPFLAGYPEAVPLAVKAINLVVEGVDVEWALHICYGNRHARPAWEGHYDFLFPAIMDAQVDQLGRGVRAQRLPTTSAPLQEISPVVQVGPWRDRREDDGVVESAQQVAARVDRALAVVELDCIIVNWDCGLRSFADQDRAREAAGDERRRGARAHARTRREGSAAYEVRLLQ